MMKLRPKLSGTRRLLTGRWVFFAMRRNTQVGRHFLSLQQVAMPDGKLLGRVTAQLASDRCQPSPWPKGHWQ